MKKLLILSACLWALDSSPVLAQTSAAEITVVQFHLGTGRLLIVRPGGKVTDLPLDNGGSVKAQTEAAQTIYTVIDGLYQEGYELKSTYSPGYSATLVFVRRK